MNHDKLATKEYVVHAQKTAARASSNFENAIHEYHGTNPSDSERN